MAGAGDLVQSREEEDGVMLGGSGSEGTVMYLIRRIDLFTQDTLFT